MFLDKVTAMPFAFVMCSGVIPDSRCALYIENKASSRWELSGKQRVARIPSQLTSGEVT
jgi:hypothetical protein